MSGKRLIDANEVIRGMEEIMRSPWFNDDKYTRLVKKDAFHVVKNLCVDSAPTIDAVEVTHAGLIETGMDEAWCSWGDCTNCGYSNIMGSKYCNECGAKLDGGANDEKS